MLDGIAGPDRPYRLVEELHQEGEYELSLEVWNNGDDLTLYWTYQSQLYGREFVEGLAERFVRLLTAVCDEPDRPLAELRPRFAQEVATEPPRARQESRCVHEWFEEVAAAAPDAIALEHEGRLVSYGELNARANRLARHLRGLGVGAEVLVALCLPRGEQQVVGLLAVLKAGGAYVPLDPASPVERLAFVLEDSAPGVVVTQDGLPEGLAVSAVPVVDVTADAPLWAGLAAEDLCADGVSAANAAYVIYTSGSSGVPKGVLVEHRNVTRLFTSTAEWFRFGERDVWTLFHSFAFDFSVWEIFGALLYGGRLVIVPQAVTRDPRAFHRLLCASGVTVLNQTPSAFQQLIAAQGADAEPHALRLVVFGGEALDVASLKPWTARAVNRGSTWSTCTASPRRRCTSPTGSCRRRTRSGRSARSASGSPTCGPTCWTRTAGRCRTARWASCTSAARAWRAGT